MCPRNNPILTREVRMMKESQEGVLARLVAIQENLRKGGIIEEESDQENEGSNVEEMDPDDRRFMKMLQTVKGEGTDVKMELPMYEGKMNSEEVLDWINALDNYFEYKEMPKEQKVKLAKTKLKGLALTWWNYVQSERLRKGKEKISSWDWMVSKVKSQFLPKDYAIQTFKRLHNLKQKDMDVIAYTEEFHKLTMRTGYNKDEVEIIARYINGLRLNIQEEISLATPRILEECFQLVVRVEEKIKWRQE